MYFSLNPRRSRGFIQHLDPQSESLYFINGFHVVKVFYNTGWAKKNFTSCSFGVVESKIFQCKLNILKIEKILASPLAAARLGGPRQNFFNFIKCSTLH